MQRFILHECLRRLALARQLCRRNPRSYDFEISAQFVSHAAEQLQQQITEWQSCPLGRVYPVMFVDGLLVSVRTEKVSPKPARGFPGFFQPCAASSRARFTAVRTSWTL
jgi:hypothetical protein